MIDLKRTQDIRFAPRRVVRFEAGGNARDGRAVRIEITGGSDRAIDEAARLVAAAGALFHAAHIGVVELSIIKGRSHKRPESNCGCSICSAHTTLLDALALLDAPTDDDDDIDPPGEPADVAGAGGGEDVF